ncbi:MAG: hypothetical protein OXC44_04705 [Proteobacteria bacterium]|nr:hypothetical protein [Pseudomonadota bacterium]
MNYQRIKYRVCVAISALSMAAILLMPLSCSDIELARKAAKSTQKMHKKMDDMYDLMKSLYGETTDMKDLMKVMVDFMKTMGSSMDQMVTMMVSMQKDMGIMKDDMQKMLKIMGKMMTMMKQMDSTVTEMKGAMDDMMSLMEHMSDYGKQAVSSLMRHIFWTTLTSETTYIEEKISAAAMYFYAFEYQTISKKGLLDKEKTSTLMYQAMREFAYKAYTLAQDYSEGTKWSLVADKKSNKINALYALAAALHEYNYEQLDDNDHPITFEDMFKNVLMANRHQNSEDRDYNNLEEYIKEGLEWRKLIYYLMQLRHGFLSGVVVQKISSLDKTAHYEKSWSVKKTGDHLSKLSMLLSGWRPDFFADHSKVVGWQIHYPTVATNLRLLEKISEYAKRANDVRDFLKCYQYPLKMYGHLQTMITNLNTDEDVFDKHVLEYAGSGNDKDHKIVTDFIKNIGALKSSVQDAKPAHKIEHDDVITIWDISSTTNTDGDDNNESDNIPHCAK